ncbi:MAG TPA: hypothetical protein VE402_03440 [Candidatus Angelobacter sp.]|nr:hypothetical protein [Candidatus Angelobacter sp.]
MPIDITDDRARVDVIRLLGPTKTIQPMKDHAFYEHSGFQWEREMAMILRR